MELFSRIKAPKMLKLKSSTLKEINPGKEMLYNLSTGYGNVCQPVVKVGDMVEVSQVIGESSQGKSEKIYSTVSGKVLKIIDSPNNHGSRVPTIIIENDGEYKKQERQATQQVDYEIYIEALRKYSLTDTQGIKLYEKYKVDNPKDITSIIINASSWDINSLVLQYFINEKSVEIMEAVNIIKSIFVNASIFFVFNKKDGFDYDKLKSSQNVNIKLINKKYNHKMEKQLINEAIGNTSENKVLVDEIQSLLGIYSAVKLNEPVINEVITITDPEMNSLNYKVRVGTKISDIYEALKIKEEQIDKIARNGLISGQALIGASVPVTQGTESIAFIKYKKPESERACIRCGECVNVCPLNLYPIKLINYINKEDSQEFKKYRGDQCVECGLCSYVCPSRINLSSKIALGKSNILK